MARLGTLIPASHPAYTGEHTIDGKDYYFDAGYGLARNQWITVRWRKTGLDQMECLPHISAKSV